MSKVYLIMFLLAVLACAVGFGLGCAVSNTGTMSGEAAVSLPFGSGD